MLQKFQFFDRGVDWALEPTHLLPLNLLVGISGVGKSRVLGALRSVARAGAGLGSAPPNCEWELTVLADGQPYIWHATTGERADQHGGMEMLIETDSMLEFAQRRRETRYVEELISTRDGTVIASRNTESVTFGGSPAPKLKETESLISLFQREPAISPIHRVLSHVFMSSMAEFEFPFWSQKQVAKWRREITTIEQLREAIRVPLIARFDILRTVAEPVYLEVVESFKEIFETVRDVRVGLARELLLESGEEEESQMLTIAVDEEGIQKPILLAELSSGMRRTLRHLVELALAPEGSTVLIDEYENSLGVNCLPSVTRHLINRTRDLQLIATSHHPYVINNIDIRYWRVVTRVAGRVRIIDASDLPELTTSSRQEAFIRLMNSSAYRTGLTGRE